MTGSGWDSEKSVRERDSSLRAKDRVSIHRSPSILRIVLSLIDTGADRTEIPLVFEGTVNVYISENTAIGYPRQMRFYPDSVERVVSHEYGDRESEQKTWKICGYIYGESDILQLLFADSPERPFYTRFVAIIGDDGRGRLEVACS